MSQVKEAEIDPASIKDANFATAKFSARYPSRHKPRGVIVMVPGSNGDGRNDIYSTKWAKFAEKHDLALVGCQLIDKSIASAEWYADAKRGSGEALIRALYLLNLANLPLYLWGFSAGGEFNYEFACWAAPRFPGLLKAFIVNKGGFYYTALAPEETRNIPSIWFIGEKDAHFRQAGIHGIYVMNLTAGCKWEEVWEEGHHTLGRSELKSMQLFERVIAEDSKRFQ